ncbi:primase-helicase family protein [Spirosoma areae]
MAFLKAQDIYEATQGGLDVITRYIPDAADCVGKKKTFRFDVYDTKPSCSIYEHGGLYWVKNHGESDPAMNAIEVVMKLNNCDFSTAVKTIAQDFGLKADDKDVAGVRAEYRKTPAPAGVDEKWFELEFKDFSLAELKGVFSNEVWKRLSYDSKTKQTSDEVGILEAQKLCIYYHFRSLASFKYIGRDKETQSLVVHEFRSTENYPIFCFDEQEFKKIYKPKEPKLEFRFRYFGTKPTTFLHGLAQHQRKIAETNAEADKKYDSLTDEEKKKKRSEEFKLPELMLLSGGSDALNVAALGYHVVWKNSETDTLNERDYKTMEGMAETLYQLPDLDPTGVASAHRLAMEHLDLRTIWLPDWLNQKRDWRGNACKDVRDYLRYAKRKDFDGLVANAYPYKFWEESQKMGKGEKPIYRKGKPVMKYTPHPVLVMNFLYRNGFARLHAPSNPETTFIFVTGNIVRKVETKDVRAFIRQFLESRHLDWDLRSAFARTTDLSDGMLEQLPERKLDFQDFCPNSQWMFFQNVCWEIRKDSIVEHKPEKAGRYVWENEVIPHQVKLLDPAFTANRSDEDQYNLTLTNTEGTFLRYLILASRVYWRKELEEKLDATSEALRPAYRELHRYDLSGPLLSELEQREQQQHLLNKLCAFGYLLHRYKDPANAYCVWSTDYTVRDLDESHGGTGKSLAANAMINLMQTETLDGRNPRLTQNPHVFENVTEHTDQILLDDAQKYIEFEFFFSLITSFMKVNPKGKKGFTIPQELAPKLHITSNFPPLKADTSTLRRIWFMAYSDYFHYNPGGEYREERRPIDEFNKRFFKEDFGAEEWNHFLNLMARSVQAWLSLGKVNPPLEQMMANAYRNKVGSEFAAWADVFFDEDHTNAYVQRIKAFEIYKREVSSQTTPQKWHSKLEYWCLYKGYVLNPAELKGYREDGRITWRGTKEVWQNNAWTKTGERPMLEYVYIQTHSPSGIGMAELTERGLEVDLGTAFN